MSVPVCHEEGLVFIKVQADTGITYVSVDPQAYTDTQQLLVRHGNPETGRCGYYPVSLLLANTHARRQAAYRRGKRPPSENWVETCVKLLSEAGAAFIHPEGTC